VGEAEDDDTGGPQTGVTVREGPGAPVHPRASSVFDEGTQIGRYVVREVIGKGGMGVVYLAFDPELDRRVAVKLLKSRTAEGTLDQAWLVREAQALARLSHPNVIAVHDVGTVEDGHSVFIAMEHVEGHTLRRWSKDQARSWADVVTAMRGAGAGLAAAHAAGLVHRDFKPDNVLVGDDGRVRVMDFGLARLRPTDSEPVAVPLEEPPTRPSDASIDSSKFPLARDSAPSLTLAGEVYGTPAYMAPELYEGKPADARTDQFAFGVTLFEALYRIRPFDRTALQWPRDAPPVPRPAPPSDVPPRIHRVAMRAIAIDPGERYPSLEALLDDLVVELPGTRRRTFALVGGGLLAASGALALVLARSQAEAVAPPEPCQGFDARLAGIWDAPMKSTIERAFTETKASYANQTFASLARSLDTYASAWRTTATASCRATRVARSQTEEALSLVQACLDQRLEELGALTSVLAKADPALVEKADKAAWQLDPVAECTNVAALRAPDQPDPALVPRIAPALAYLAQAKAARAVGRMEDALTACSAASALAEKLAFEPLTAAIAQVRGGVLTEQGKYEEAMVALEQAVWAGMRGHHDALVAATAMTAARVSADGLGRPREADLWIQLGAAEGARAGADRHFVMERLAAEGIVAAAKGDMLAAIASHERALAQAEGIHGRTDPAIWQYAQALAATLAKTGEYARAQAYYERALALREGSAGPNHPDVALILTSLGACYDHVGEHAQARAALDRALAIRENAFGAASPRLVATLNNLADLLKRQGDLPSALGHITRAKTIAADKPGTAHPLYHIVVTTLAEILHASGRTAEAKTELAAVLELETAGKSPVRATTLTAQAVIAIAEKAWPLAAAASEQAIALFEASGGPQNPELWRPLATLASARVALGQPAVARDHLMRAISIAEAAKLAPADIALLKTQLAALSP